MYLSSRHLLPAILACKVEKLNFTAKLQNIKMYTIPLQNLPKRKTGEKTAKRATAPPTGTSVLFQDFTVYLNIKINLN